jgi:hypothetical protein
MIKKARASEIHHNIRAVFLGLHSGLLIMLLDILDTKILGRRGEYTEIIFQYIFSLGTQRNISSFGPRTPGAMCNKIKTILLQ